MIKNLSWELEKFSEHIRISVKKSSCQFEISTSIRAGHVTIIFNKKKKRKILYENTI